MITIQLRGRTGNNLFQYAAGRAQALRHGTGLVLDGSWANTSQELEFRKLFCLPLQAEYRTRGRFIKHPLNRCGLKPYRLHRGHIHMESSPFYDSSFHSLPDGVRLHGFYQSHRYFESIERELRNELDVSCVTLDSTSLKFEEALRYRNAVSIHVRRGDYLEIPATQCLPTDYHDRAIRQMRDLVEDPVFCVFSDDIPWCRTRFTGPEFLFCDLSGSDATPLHDLRLMAACSHHIIVNSSYSWWGAWLNSKPNKKVILPKWWMTRVNSDDLTLPTWIQLDQL